MQESVTLNITKIFSVFIAILPLIQVYRFPFSTMSCATILILLFTPVVLWCIFLGISENKNKAYGTLPLLAYCLWGLTKCSGSPIDFALFIVIYLYVLSITVSNIFNVTIARKTVELMSLVASTVVIAQSIAHYAFGATNQIFCARPWVIDALQYYFDEPMILFRPSALFIEPAHFAEYCVIGLVSVLFSNTKTKLDITTAAFISLGMIATTSGIGLVLCAFTWGLLLFKNPVNIRNMMGRIFGGLIAAVIVYFILMQFSFFSTAVQRIFGEVHGYNAIQGRLFWWDTYFKKLTMNNWIYGLGYSMLPAEYFTGFMKVIYSSGLIGLGLLVISLINAMLHNKGFYFWVSVIFLGLLLPANITSFILMIFWFSFIYSEYVNKRNIVIQ